MAAGRPYTVCMLAFILFSAVQCQATLSSKRGLASVSNKHSTEDQKIWTANNSDISWYYNWSPDPQSAFSSLDFVPLLFKAPDSGDTSFVTAVRKQIGSITAILSFNEPDGSESTGGTDTAPSIAAAAYVANILQLRNEFSNLRVGLPAVTGAPSGITWLENFNKSCEAINPGHGCPADFIPIHWYGNFEGLASRIGQIRELYPKIPMWITEFADPNQSLSDTQSNFNETLDYFDWLEYVERYSYFGGFRAEDSGVGANAAMLDNGGQLTDIGAIYLGEALTGNDPNAGGVGRISPRSSCWLGIVLAMGAVFVL